MNNNFVPQDMKPIQCAECDGMYFRQVMAIKKVSKFLKGADKHTMIPIPVYLCDDCGAIPAEFQPIKTKLK